MNKILLLLTPILLFSSTLVKTYQTGETYEFAEKDMIEEIQNQIKNNKPQIESKLEEFKNSTKEKINNYKPSDLKNLTPATKYITYYPDMTYTNPDNIYDNKGDIIYPKGFKFNPLDYQTINYQIIVVNGQLDNEIEWIIKNNYIGNTKYMILLSDGDYKRIEEKLHQPIFYAVPKITEKFKLEHTPSIITQIGNKIEVKEICLSCQKENIK